MGHSFINSLKNDKKQVKYDIMINDIAELFSIIFDE
jgi:hypothetical protein